MVKDIRSKQGPRRPVEAPVENVRPNVRLADVPSGTVADVEDWVSGDKVRAAAALKVEKKRGDDARTSLVESLERLVNDETGAGIGSGEA